MPSVAAGSTVVKNLPTSARGARDSASIPGAGGSFLEKEKATYSNMLAWEIPRTTEPGKLLPMGPQRVRHS